MSLTESQVQAVEHFQGPLLVLAGPGSGKTRVITQRILRLYDRGIPAHQILAITFTNKASREMAERVEKLLPEKRIRISTFHSFCAWMLRGISSLVGLQSNFTIYDVPDQQQLLKRALEEAEVGKGIVTPAQIGQRISRLKNQLVTAEEFHTAFQEGHTTGNPIENSVTATVYPIYQKLLLQANAADFDDLLMYISTILTENPEIRSEWDDRFRYILVDEFQDTNMAQYRIVRAMSQIHPNLCVTGDPDQSIYSWRGAEIANILHFERDYPQARVIKLEENFRSTKSILRAADSLIGYNIHRKQKQLWTHNAEGRHVSILKFGDAGTEAELLAQFLSREVLSGRRVWSDFVLLYRVNSLSRRFEISFNRNRIPFQVAAGVSFYERAVVRDLLAYLRLIHNPKDQGAFLRIVNKPTRGIGDQSQRRILEFAGLNGYDLISACQAARSIPKLSKKGVISVERFGDLMSQLVMISDRGIAPLLISIVQNTGYLDEDTEATNEAEIERRGNIEELIAAAREYDQTNPGGSLAGFLDSCALVSDVDAVDPEQGVVTLMTLHASKGLEFPVVIIVAFEERLIPHELARNDGPRGQEEERRLLFVGMTRAEKELYLTQSSCRDIRGMLQVTMPSSFQREFDAVSETIVDGDLIPEPTQQAIPRPKFELPRERDLPKLTTGAALLEGKRETVNVPRSFEQGMSVRHPSYGAGVVVESGKKTITVEFQDGNRISFVPHKCPLQPIGFS